MEIKEVYNDEYLATINKQVYEKLQDVYYFETTGKKQVLNNINTMIDKIKEKTNISHINIEDTNKGYYIKYTIDNKYNHEIFAYTLSEVIIHLQNFIK